MTGHREEEEEESLGRMYVPRPQLDFASEGMGLTCLEHAPLSMYARPLLMTKMHESEGGLCVCGVYLVQLTLLTNIH